MAEMATRSTKATLARGSAQRYTLAPAGGRIARLDKMRSQPGTRWNRRGELSGSGSCWRRRGRPSNSALRGAATSLCRQNRAGELPRTDLRTAGRERFYVVAAPHRLQVVLQLLGKRAATSRSTSSATLCVAAALAAAAQAASAASYVAGSPSSPSRAAPSRPGESAPHWGEGATLLIAIGAWVAASVVGLSPAAAVIVPSRPPARPVRSLI